MSHNLGICTKICSGILTIGVKVSLHQTSPLQLPLPGSLPRGHGLRGFGGRPTAVERDFCRAHARAVSAGSCSTAVRWFESLSVPRAQVHVSQGKGSYAAFLLHRPRLGVHRLALFSKFPVVSVRVEITEGLPAHLTIKQPPSRSTDNRQPLRTQPRLQLTDDAGNVVLGADARTATQLVARATVEPPAEPLDGAGPMEQHSVFKVRGAACVHCIWEGGVCRAPGEHRHVSHCTAVACSDGPPRP